MERHRENKKKQDETPCTRELINTFTLEGR